VAAGAAGDPVLARVDLGATFSGLGSSSMLTTTFQENLMHRIALGAALAAAALSTFAAPARAAAPTRIDAEYWGVTCVADLGGGQSLFLFGGGTTDGAEGGIGAFIEDAS